MTKLSARYRKTIRVPLRDLGRDHRNKKLQRIADEGLLTIGDAALAAEVRGRHAEIVRVA